MRLRDPYRISRRRSLIGILGVVLVFFVGISWLILGMTSRSFVETSNDDLEASSLSAPVTVTRDSYGIPYIEGANESDVMFALGYVHAQDRLWQMEVKRRVAAGRLSELLGTSYLGIDAYLRSFGMVPTAEKILSQTPEETLTALESYAAGVNAFVHRHEGRIPFEFDALGFEPEPWTPLASILTVRLIAFEQNTSLWADLFYERLHTSVDSLLAADLKPWYPSYGETIIPGGQRPEPQLERIRQGIAPVERTDSARSDSAQSTIDSGQALQDDATAFLEQMGQLPVVAESLQRIVPLGGSPIGSNGWVISGNRTRSGKPLLANDPHSRQSVPTKWYQATLNVDGMVTSGVTLPGIPFVVIGRNNHVAWGITALNADETDLYLERLHPDGSDRALHDGRWEKMSVMYDTIHAKDTVGTPINIRSTRHGPIISDHADIFASYSPIGFDSGQTAALTSKGTDTLGLAVRWLGRDVTHELRALQLMGRATSMKSFREALSHAGIPGWGVLFANRANDIAYFPVFRAPMRNGTRLNRVNPGWSSSYNWRGIRPVSALKPLINPASGYIGSANNKLSNQAGFSIGDQWDDPSRAHRIVDFLDEGNQLEVIDCVQMQSDLASSYMSHMVDYLLRAFPDSIDQGSKVREGLSLLRGWSGDMGSDAPQGLIAAAWLQRVFEKTWRDEMGQSLYNHYLSIGHLPRLAMRRQMMVDSRWFDDVTTSKREIRDDILRISFGETLENLNIHFGTWDLKEWSYGSLHTLSFTPALSVVEGMSGVVEVGPFPLGGSPTTLNTSSWDYRNPFDVVVGPTMRQIVDFADTSTYVRSVVSTGASGQPMNDRYADQTVFWLFNGYISLSKSPSSPAEQLSRMTMRPGS